MIAKSPEERRYYQARLKRSSQSIRNAIFLTVLAAFNASAVKAENYLLRVEPMATKTEATKGQGTIEFHVVAGEPFFVRSTLGNESQFLLRGSLQKTGKVKFEVEYFCQISELRTDP